jgi:hypothetical protein
MLREAAANVSLPKGSCPGIMKITSSAISESTVSVSPLLLAAIHPSGDQQVATSSHMACSSSVIGFPHAHITHYADAT